MNNIYRDWLFLIIEAKEAGLTVKEVREFLHQRSELVKYKKN
ncbi:anti-repressor SinI family protein [Salipaludibacillus sp. CUR1]|nr:DNA-binding anti-repressor SinI [Salipaludibacillus sp. CUR1]MCE7792296.1 anti-repressor SinI family protein [Salipaludibacillus sp. CUR1]